MVFICWFVRSGKASNQSRTLGELGDESPHINHPSPPPPPNRRRNSLFCSFPFAPSPSIICEGLPACSTFLSSKHCQFQQAKKAIRPFKANLTLSPIFDGEIMGQIQLCLILCSRTSGRCHQPFTADEKTEEESSLFYLYYRPLRARKTRGKNRTENRAVYLAQYQVISHGCVHGVAHIQQQQTATKILREILFDDSQIDH